MTRELAVRIGVLYVPIVLAGSAAAWRFTRSNHPPIDPRRLGASALSCTAWMAPSLLVLHFAAQTSGWWTFTARGGLLLGFPIDFYLGWLVLWGVMPPLLLTSLAAWQIAAAMLVLDLVLMPLCVPVIRLSEWWLAGEAAGIAGVLLPGLYLARWTQHNTHLAWRATLQAIAFAGLMLLVVPAAVLTQVGDDAQALWARSTQWNGILAQLVAIPAVLGLSAVQEFVVRGRGTPLPYDPPSRLVTTGAYAYVANPMQVAMVLVFLGWGALLGSLWLMAGAVIAFAYGAGLAQWHEDNELVARYGTRWVEYRSHVRKWWPRWWPFIASAADPSARARLYVAASCATCQSVAEWLHARGVVGLDVIPAELHPARDLTRITYEPADDSPPDDGIAAFGRALEHIHLGWAWIGMFVRLPLVRPFVQLLVDASGGQPRRVCATRSQDAAPSAPRETHASRACEAGPKPRHYVHNYSSHAAAPAAATHSGAKRPSPTRER